MATAIAFQSVTASARANAGLQRSAAATVTTRTRVIVFARGLLIFMNDLEGSRRRQSAGDEQERSRPPERKSSGIHRDSAGLFNDRRPGAAGEREWSPCAPADACGVVTPTVSAESRSPARLPLAAGGR